MGTGELSAKPNKMLGLSGVGLASHPGGVAIAPSRLHATETGISSGSVSLFDPERRLYCYHL